MTEYKSGVFQGVRNSQSEDVQLATPQVNSQHPKKEWLSRSPAIFPNKD